MWKRIDRPNLRTRPGSLKRVYGIKLYEDVLKDMDSAAISSAMSTADLFRHAVNNLLDSLWFDNKEEKKE